MYILYFFIAIIIIIICILGYIKVSQPFWSIQPVFHAYDIHYFFSKNKIIMEELPKPNKYTNFLNVKTKTFDKINNENISQILNILSDNYLKPTEGKYLPQIDNFLPYFRKKDSSYLSVYLEDIHEPNLKNGTIETIKKPFGIITSRILNVTYNNNSVDNVFDVFYVDYLCVDKDKRKLGIAPQLIQTHNYNQRHLNKTTKICLFKREHEITGIVPLTFYYTYGFSVKTWNKPNNLPLPYSFVKVSKTNFSLFWDFLKSNVTKFKLRITFDTFNLIDLIKSDNIIIYLILFDDKVKACYFFRKTCVKVDNDLEVLSCFASINTDLQPFYFNHGFKISFWDAAYNGNYGFCAVEDLSDNNIIINELIKVNKPLVKSPTAYFFYNYIFSTLISNNVFIIN